MAAVRYFNLHKDNAPRTVSTSGQQPGPPGGDGWSAVSVLPYAKIGHNPAAIFVSGRISNKQLFGVLPANPTGHLQICLGDSTGVRHPLHVFHVSVEQVLELGQGLQFSFLALVGDPDTDPVWTGNWPVDVDLVVYARLNWASDAPVYGFNWDISDLEFLVAKHSFMPSGHYYVGVDDTPAAIDTNSGSPLVRTMAGPSVAAEWQMLHFAVVYWRTGPIDSATQAPHEVQWSFCNGFFLGSPEQRVPIIPSQSVASQAPDNRSCGQSWQGRAPLPARLRTLGAFWHTTGDGLDHRFSVIGRDVTNNVNQQATFLRAHYFSVRVDLLPNVSLRYWLSVADMTEDYTSQLSSNRYVSDEVGAQGLSFEPYILCSAQIDRVTPAGSDPRSFGLHLRDNLGEIYALPARFVSRLSRVEPQHFTAADSGIGYGDSSFQLRILMLQPGQTQIHHTVRDIYFAQFHPVSDPDGIPPNIPDVDEPVAIVPGAESPPAGSLPLPPLQPDANMRETILSRLESLTGSTGYRRTWGVWLKPRRVFGLSWSAISRADANAVVAFLRAGKLWQMPAPRAQPIAVTAVTEPQIAQLSPFTFSVSVDVAELVYNV